MVIKQDLTIPPAWADHTTTTIADGHDRLKVSSPLGAGRRQRYELCTRSSSEVVQVDASVHTTFSITYGGTDRMHDSIGIGVDDSASKLNQSLVCLGQPLEMLCHER